jgi:dienelactone hydrolase
MPHAITVLFFLAFSRLAFAQPLPGTVALERDGDLAAQMVESMDQYLLARLAASDQERKRYWQTPRDLAAERKRLAAILGVRDPRLQPPRMESMGGQAVRWPVLEGVDGEGWLLRPSGEPKAAVVVIPDADGGVAFPPAAVALSRAGCLVLVPVLIDRTSRWSGNPAVRMTRRPHREWVYRMAYPLGRHILGYEIQKVLAAVDWFSSAFPGRRIALYGSGEGAVIALYAAALDERILVTGLAEPLRRPELIWQEPLWRNVWTLLRRYGDEDLVRMAAPRPVLAGATPGDFAAALGLKLEPAPATPIDQTEADARQQRQLRQLVDFTQKLVWMAEHRRKEFFPNPGEPLEAHRNIFRQEILGVMPPPDQPLRAQTRRLYDTPKFTGWEVLIPVWGDVFAYGVLLLPKAIQPGDRRPVVVCQHGLEGRPQYLIDPPDERNRDVYKRYAAVLAERGYIVYAPQNPYIGGERFRRLQRKANPLGLSLFSFIAGQHARTLDWLTSLPFVDPERIAFYGLSYGGTTALRVPPVEPRYRVVICSANFNEWTWKIARTDYPFTYPYTGEYEIVEFNQGETFGHYEMAALIAPRPFMVERGHYDGVGIDEWVAYEFAKVARFYRLLGAPDRAQIEYFDGSHAIHGVGTFSFLDRWLHHSSPQ